MINIEAVGALNRASKKKYINGPNKLETKMNRAFLISKMSLGEGTKASISNA